MSCRVTQKERQYLTNGGHKPCSTIGDLRSKKADTTTSKPVRRKAADYWRREADFIGYRFYEHNLLLGCNFAYSICPFM